MQFLGNFDKIISWRPLTESWIRHWIGQRDGGNGAGTGRGWGRDRAGGQGGEGRVNFTIAQSHGSNQDYILILVIFIQKVGTCVIMFRKLDLDKIS